MQFLQNHIANYDTKSNAQKVMLSPLKMPNIRLLVQTCLAYPIIWTTNTFSKIWLCHFLLYMAEYPHAKN